VSKTRFNPFPISFAFVQYLVLPFAALKIRRRRKKKEGIP
jgi:hypothetical protein